MSDLSTALLMIKFYQNRQTEPLVAIVLNTAQSWLRNVNPEEILENLFELREANKKAIANKNNPTPQLIRISHNER